MNWLYGFYEPLSFRETWRYYWYGVKLGFYRTKKEMDCPCNGKITFYVRPAMVDDYGPIAKAACDKCGTMYTYSYHVTPLGDYGIEMPKNQ